MWRNSCRSVISLQEPLPRSLWIFLDLHGTLAIVWTTPHSVVFFCVCLPPKRHVDNITSPSLLNRKYLLLLSCLLKVSQYQLALIDTAYVHIVKGISQHIHNTSQSVAFPRNRHVILWVDYKKNVFRLLKRTPFNNGLQLIVLFVVL